MAGTSLVAATTSVQWLCLTHKSLLLTIEIKVTVKRTMLKWYPDGLHENLIEIRANDRGEGMKISASTLIRLL